MRSVAAAAPWQQCCLCMQSKARHAALLAAACTLHCASTLPCWRLAPGTWQLISPCLPAFVALQYDLPVSLEELASGCTKSVTHTRKVLTEMGEVIKEQRTCSVTVAPGRRDGTAFVFQG